MDNLDDMPGHLVRRFHQITVAAFHLEVGKLNIDITPVQYAALATVAANEGIDQATLAGMIANDRTTIGGVVDRLVQKGLLTRAVSGKDRRAHALRITIAGQNLMTEVAPAVLRAQNAMLQGLDEFEAEEFMRLLGKAIAANNALSRAPMRPKPAR